MENSKKHKMAGIAVKVEEGPFKGQYFKVIDYMVNQYQGKDIEKIAATQAQLVTPVVGRGYPLDDKIVFGQLYPAMTFMCVHDDELKIKTAQPPLKIVSPPTSGNHAGDPDYMEIVKEKEDDSGTTDQGDSGTTGSGDAGDGRTVSSPKLSIQDGGKSKGKGKKN